MVASWIELFVLFISGIMNRLSNDWIFLGVSMLGWIVGCLVLTILIRNFIYDV